MKIKIWALLNKNAGDSHWANLHWSMYRALTSASAFICITLNVVLSYSQSTPTEGIDSLLSLYFFSSFAYFLVSMLGEVWLKVGIIVSLTFSVIVISLALSLWLPEITSTPKTLVRPSAITHTVSVVLFTIFHSFMALMTIHTFIRHGRKRKRNRKIQSKTELPNHSKNSTKD